MSISSSQVRAQRAGCEPSSPLLAHPTPRHTPTGSIAPCRIPTNRVLAVVGSFVVFVLLSCVAYWLRSRWGEEEDPMMRREREIQARYMREIGERLWVER